jgi:hypothetical protein
VRAAARRVKVKIQTFNVRKATFLTLDCVVAHHYPAGEWTAFLAAISTGELTRS